jgi:hypothetical protein
MAQFFPSREHVEKRRNERRDKEHTPHLPKDKHSHRVDSPNPKLH